MSRRVERYLLLGALIVLLLVPTEGWCQAAQTPTELQARTDGEASLLRAIEELLPRIEEASAHAREMDDIIEAARAQRSRPAVDTLSVSAWTVYASDRDAPDAAEAFEVVGREFDWARGLPPGARHFTVSRWSATPPVEVDGLESRSVSASPWRGYRALERKVRDAMAHAVGSSLPPAVRVWTQNSPVSATVSSLERGRMFRELRLTPSRATRGCVDGDTMACRVALGLTASPFEQGAAYEPAQLEAVVAYRMHRRVPEECLAIEPGAACQTWWEDGTTWTQAIPLHGVTRANFLGFVLARSGPTAVEDFLHTWEERAASDTRAPEAVTRHLVPVLEKVSGDPIDRLVGDFRNYIMSGATQRAATPGTDGLGAILWVLLAAALASRSTRWRLG